MENEYSILLQQILRHTDNDINTYKTSLLNLMTRLNQNTNPDNTQLLQSLYTHPKENKIIKIILRQLYKTTFFRSYTYLTITKLSKLVYTSETNAHIYHKKTVEQLKNYKVFLFKNIYILPPIPHISIKSVDLIFDCNWILICFEQGPIIPVLHVNKFEDISLCQVKLSMLYSKTQTMGILKHVIQS